MGLFRGIATRLARALRALALEVEAALDGGRERPDAPPPPPVPAPRRDEVLSDRSRAMIADGLAPARRPPPPPEEGPLRGSRAWREQQARHRRAPR